MDCGMWLERPLILTGDDRLSNDRKSSFRVIHLRCPRRFAPQLPQVPS
jgi:hypothetical protein